MKHCEDSKDIHVIFAAFPQLHPASTVPLADPSPSVLRGDFFDPNEDRAKRKICIADFATHRHDTVTVRTGVLVKEVSEGIKLFLDSLPGLLPLRRSKLGGWLLGLRPHEVGTTALRESEMSHGDHDGKKRFCEDLVYVVDEEALESARSFRKDWSSRICVFEVFGYVVGIGERFPTAGVIDNRESVNWPAIGAIRGWGNVQLAKDVLNVGCFDPMRAVRKTFIIEDESTRKDHFNVQDEQNEMSVHT